MLLDVKIINISLVFQYKLYIYQIKTSYVLKVL
jgi:hypothetical protein